MFKKLRCIKIFISINRLMKPFLIVELLLNAQFLNRDDI